MSDLQSGQNSNRDPFDRALGGLILILLGVLFWMVQSDFFILNWSNVWGAFMIGLGALLIVQAIGRIFFPSYRRNVFGLIIGGLILIAIGTIPFGGMIWAQWWPLGLIALGVVLLIQQFVRR